MTNPNMHVYLQTAPGKINPGSKPVIPISVDPANHSILSGSSSTGALNTTSGPTKQPVFKRNTTTGAINTNSSAISEPLSLKLPTAGQNNRNSGIRGTRKKSLSLTGEDQRRFLLQV
jgi:hypothetical protein